MANIAPIAIRRVHLLWFEGNLIQIITFHQRPENKLFDNGKSNAIVSHVEFSVVTPDEDVAQDPKWAIWWWDIDAYETAETNLFPHRTDHQNIIFPGQVKSRASNNEWDGRQRRNQIACDHILAADHWGAADSLIQFVNFFDWASN